MQNEGIEIRLLIIFFIFNSQTNGLYGWLGMKCILQIPGKHNFTSLEVIAGWVFISHGNLVHFPILRPGPQLLLALLSLSEEQLCSTSPGLTSALLF